MPVYTLLDMVQLILSSMDSDEVNSIGDTAESLQVANIIRTSYDDLLARMDFPERFNLCSLEDSVDTTLPIKMLRPNSLDKLIWIKYNKQALGETSTRFEPVGYKTPEDFVEYVSGFRIDSDRRGEYSPLGTNLNLYYRSNSAPTYWTSFNDNDCYFDSYDSDVDTTLQASKTLVYGKLNTGFILDDLWKPALDADQASLLFNEAKAMVFAELKQTTHARAEKKVREAMIKAQTSKNAMPGSYPFINTLPNYGRR